jgi:uracil-DNA glycosylase family 4
VNVYSCVHAAPAPSAPTPVTTYISPSPASGEVIVQAVSGLETGPVTHIRHFVLDFPEMPPDPAVGVAMVEQRYQGCARCHLSETRMRIVHVRGNYYSPVVAIGEGPGRNEDSQGLPFVGVSGRLQDQLFRDAGIDPHAHIAWMNLVGCRPCENRFTEDRRPSLCERIACSERTLMLLRALRPRIVLCLGKEAADIFFDEDHVPGWFSWTTLPGPPEQPQDWVQVGVVKHPAALARSLSMPNAYGDYKRSVLFYRALREQLESGIEKVSRWPYGLRYLANVTPFAGKHERKR